MRLQPNHSQHHQNGVNNHEDQEEALLALVELRTREVKSLQSDKYQRVPTEQEVKVKDRGSKRKYEHKEDVNLISLISKSSSPELLSHQISHHFSSQHKRRVRCVAVCPVNDHHFVTSALDGVVNLWDVHSSEYVFDFLLSHFQRWPEDVVWHPEGNSLLSVYSADGQDHQISVTDFSRVKGGGRAYVNFIEDKPHVKGVINSIVFLPWENTSFVTGGTDHAVVLWRENDQNKWK
ncbi:unnamed protein product [Sphenostylis stenocarpa]|uniref:Uncharacterized protein n=1 Tax=Sphenostylis stenocarpa TaxID=92480 RepID=A0AA86V6S7_9FABA|nr:unnamed protein product [Sphenostylis stenocarpa]